MAKKVFISYSYKQAGWVRETLYPVLAAGGAEITIDYKVFSAGVAVRKQMQEAQAQAGVHLLVFTPDYLKSDYCLEEMQRAFAADPGFQNGAVLPIVLEPCELPPEIKAAQPLYVDLTGDRQRSADAWKLVMECCEADLGTSVPGWVEAFGRTTDALKRRKSVNLLVKSLPKWREFIAEVKRALPEMGTVDLESGKAATQRGLVGEILRELVNYTGTLPKNAEHLAEFERLLEAAPAGLLALKHFDKVSERPYSNDFYSSLRHLIMEKRKLTLLVESRAPFASLLPKNHALSFLDMETVELGGKG